MKRLLASAAVAATALGTVGFAGSAANASPHRPPLLPRSVATSGAYWTLDSIAGQVRTSTGKTLHLAVYSDKPTTGKGAVIVELFSGGSPGSLGEFHEWSFVSDALAAKAGHATLDTRQDLGKYGSLNLSFSSSTKHAVACKTGTAAYWYGSLSGKVTFNTEGRAWGSFSRKSFKFIGRNELYRDASCTVKPPPRRTPFCSKASYWSAPSSSSSSAPFFSGSDYKGSTTISAGRDVRLTSPKNAFRFDSLSGPGQKFRFAGKGTGRTVTIAATGKGFTGRATIRFATSHKYTYGACKHKGVKYTQYLSYRYGPWSSTGTSRLAAHFAIDGNPILAPKTGRGFFYVYYYS
jgi:hypothetical protein